MTPLSPRRTLLRSLGRRWTSALPFVLLVLGLCASPAESSSWRRRLAQVELLLAQWQEEDATRLLEPLLLEAPPSAALYRLHAEVLFRKGEYQKTVALLDQALARFPTETALSSMRKQVQATRDAVKDFVEQRSPGSRFVFYSASGPDEILAPFAAETLEAMRAAMETDLGFRQQDVVRVEFYPGPEVLAQVSSLSLDEIRRTGTIALCKYNRLMVVTPRALPRGYAWLDTLAHEYVHLVVSRLTRNMVPIWLHEGLAKHFERRWRQAPGELPTPHHLGPSQQHLLAEALKADRLVTLAQMHPSMAKLPDQKTAMLAFAQVETAVDFLALRIGTTGLRQMLMRMRNGDSEWQALAAVSGLSASEFTRRWRAHLRSLNLRSLPGLVPPELRFGKPPSQQTELARVQEKARRYLRLADMLRQRGLGQAAIVEYQKARGLMGSRDELLANHLARTYLELNRPAEAAAILDPVLDYYPEFPGAQATMGLARLRQGQVQAAVLHLRAALRHNPFNPEAHCHMATALKQTDSLAAHRHQDLCQRLSTGP